VKKTDIHVLLFNLPISIVFRPYQYLKWNDSLEHWKSLFISILPSMSQNYKSFFYITLQKQLPTFLRLYVPLILEGVFNIRLPESFILHCHLPFDLGSYKHFWIWLTKIRRQSTVLLYDLAIS
jgi:hypothetical protein